MSELLMNKSNKTVDNELYENETFEDELRETFVCEKCGRAYSMDNLYEFGGENLCDICYYDNTTSCEHCGVRIWTDDAISDDEIDLCESCFENYYTRCHDCEQLVHNDDAVYFHNEPHCRNCGEDHCCDDDDYDGFIHDYGYKPYSQFYGEGIYYGVELEIDKGGEAQIMRKVYLQSAMTVMTTFISSTMEA